MSWYVCSDNPSLIASQWQSWDLKSRSGHFQTECVSMMLCYILIIYKESHHPEPAWMITYTEEIGLHGKHLNLCWFKKEICKNFESLNPKGLFPACWTHRQQGVNTGWWERGRSYFGYTWDSLLPSKSLFFTCWENKYHQGNKIFSPLSFWSQV